MCQVSKQLKVVNSGDGNALTHLFKFLIFTILPGWFQSKKVYFDGWQKLAFVAVRTFAFLLILYMDIVQ